jgi:hypothetical protein
MQDWEVYGWLIAMVMQGWLALLAAMVTDRLLVYTTLVVLWTACVGAVVWLSIRWYGILYRRKHP